VYKRQVSNGNNQPSLNEIRKIAGIAIRCLENHGCPKRNMAADIFKSDM
jgi:hypothetical protein